MNTRAVVPAIFIKDGKLDFEDIAVTEAWQQDITEMVEILGAFGELLVHDVVTSHFEQTHSSLIRTHETL